MNKNYKKIKILNLIGDKEQIGGEDELWKVNDYISMESRRFEDGGPFLLDQNVTRYKIVDIQKARYSALSYERGAALEYTNDNGELDYTRYIPIWELKEMGYKLDRKARHENLRRQAAGAM
jgi:hypothetical protein